MLSHVAGGRGWAPGYKVDPVGSGRLPGGPGHGLAETEGRLQEVFYDTDGEANDKSIPPDGSMLPGVRATKG